MENTNLTIK